MSNELLSQSEIDALLSNSGAGSKRKSGAGEKITPEVSSQDAPRPLKQPGHQAPGAASSDGARNTVAKAATPQPAKMPPAVPGAPDDMSARMAEMSERLSRVEKHLGRLEQLERKIGVINTDQVLTQDQLSALRQVQKLSDDVAGISAKLQGTLGYGAFQSFQCDECGSRGTVATVFRCTKCGHHNWRGWWPWKK